MAEGNEMKQLKMGYMRPEERETFIKWVNKTPGNLYDPGILNYPTLRVLTSYNGEPVAFLPMQQALFLESLAVKEPRIENAQAFRDLVKGAEQHASSLGIRELYFLCRDERVISIAENHGFERVPYPLTRMKL